MNCLYLAEDYLHTKVHHNFCEALSQYEDIRLTVFAVRRGLGMGIGIPQPEDCSYNVEIEQFVGNSMAYKAFFPYKVKSKMAMLEHRLNPKNIQLVWAATLFSEGAVALELYKKYGIPYIVSVRGSDLNFYFKKMIHLRKKGIEILNNARKIIFITPNLQRRTLILPCLAKYSDKLAQKSEVIPNGVDSLWLENRCKPDSKTPRKILYIGHFDKNKNVLRLIEAVKLVRQQFPMLELNLVGAHGEEEELVMQQVNGHSDWLHYWGEIHDKQKLKEIYRENDIFAMVSHSETFGLVYVEALSQGLPILYTKGQGFYGQFEEGLVGWGTSSRDTLEIADTLRKIMADYGTLQKNVNTIELDRYDWKIVAGKLKTILLSK
ncbi:MAG: glycosyltransferase family 4 protein [Bacteroidales bacterium]|nr:glycosyltransferase family 4 protein [Bacteroidales bacterium]